MATLNEKIADSLEALRGADGAGGGVIRARDLSRTHTERLLAHNHLRPIMPGWLMVVDPATRPGDSTPWFASFWRFLALYCEDRFGRDWAADAGTSLRLHAGENTVPRQVVVVAPGGNNRPQDFPFGTSLFASKGDPRSSEVRDGMRVMPLGEALAKVSPAFFGTERAIALACLASVGSASDVTAPLLRGGHSVVAGRLAAAFRSIGRTGVADEIGAAMRAAGHRVTEADNPLSDVPPGLSFRRRVSPVAARIAALWAAMRGDVLAEFPEEPSAVADPAGYLADVDGRYVSDAYHSLSIEGYRVTPELIERVRRGAWRPESSAADRDQRDALAAKGYDGAFRRVRTAVADVLAGADPAAVVRDRHVEWFRELFQPSVAAGLIGPDRLAGYRRHFVYLDGSRYVPVAHASVQDAMDAYLDALDGEPDPRVRAVLGHFLFTYVHPLMDGNGRVGRFVLNVQLASGGYPWTVVPVDERAAYMRALDTASLDHDIRPFARLVADLARRAPPPPRRRTEGEEPVYPESEGGDAPRP